MTADRAEIGWMRWGAPLAMAVVVLAPLRWVLRVGDWPAAAAVSAVTVLAVLISARLSERQWISRLTLAVLAGFVAARIGGGLPGVWVLIAVVLCDWAIRRRRPAPVVPAGGEAAAAVVAVLSLVAIWLAGYDGSGIFIVVVLEVAVVATAVSGLMRPSPPGFVRTIRSAMEAVVGAYRNPRSLWGAATVGAVVWASANVVWFDVHRSARLWDHEEATYVRLVSYFASGEGGAPWSGLFVAHYGPMQALLGAPFQWLFGVNEATVVYLNIALTAVTGLLIFWTVSRLADPPAGLVAGALVLFTPGMLENARGALTMVPATTFAAVGLAALVMGGGLRRWQWAAVAGVAMGCMSLSRPMSIAFIPGLAVPAIVWSVRAATPWRTILRNGALAGIAAVAVSAWWWAVRLPLVMEYLATGSEGVATGSVGEVLDNRLYELSAYIGPIAHAETLGYTWYLSAGAFVLLFVLGGRRSTSAVATAGGALPTSGLAAVKDPMARERALVSAGAAPLRILPLWPIWAAVGVNLVVSLASNTIGWLMLPVVPWMVVATVAGVRRALSTWAWRAWAVVVVFPMAVVAVVTSTVSVTPGNRFTWCMEPWQKTSACAIEDRSTAADWKSDVQQITDDAVASQTALAEAGRADARVAVVARDHIILPSTIRFQAWIDHRRGIDDSAFLEDHFAIDGDLQQLLEQAGVVVVSPDIERFRLFPRMVDPDELPSVLLAGGFVVCRQVELRDGRVVQTFVREPAPATVCN